jgi:hypothetical protein
MQKAIPATPVVVHRLTQRIKAAREAGLAYKQASEIATDLFTVFCEDHDVPGAGFVGIKDGHVVVALPDASDSEIAREQ